MSDPAIEPDEIDKEWERRTTPDAIGVLEGAAYLIGRSDMLLEIYARRDANSKLERRAVKKSSTRPRKTDPGRT
jgi:hypothetical protein